MIRRVAHLINDEAAFATRRQPVSPAPLNNWGKGYLVVVALRCAPALNLGEGLDKNVAFRFGDLLSYVPLLSWFNSEVTLRRKVGEAYSRSNTSEGGCSWTVNSSQGFFGELVEL